MKLTVQNAEIKTAAVEVKTLTISGKQVTLAVFRQLQEQPLISKDGTLNGAPWGVVNYHPDKCGDVGHKHVHVVWQQGSDLLRARVDVVPSFDRNDYPEFSPKSGNDFYTACVLADLKGEPAKGYFSGAPIVTKYDKYSGSAEVLSYRWAKEHGLNAKLDMAPEVFDAAKVADLIPKYRKDLAEATESSYYSEEYRAKQLAKAEANFADLLVKACSARSGSPQIDELYREFDAEMSAEAARRQRHRDLRTTLNDLPQLFIAV